MKKIYATVIRNRKRIGNTCVISRELLDEILNDKKNYCVRSYENLGDIIVYDIVHKSDDGIISWIIISEEI